MRKIDFSADRAIGITQFASHGATAVACGDGDGESHVYCLRFEAGGEIGPHEAGFDQLLLVVEGSGWAAGFDGRRVELRPWQAAHFTRGEVHSKGSETGMTAVMVQAASFRPGTESEEIQ